MKYTSHLFFPVPQASVDQALEDAIAATEAEKEQVVSLNAELEALSEAPCAGIGAAGLRGRR